MLFTLFSCGFLVIFYAVFFDLASTVLPYFIALTLIILAASTLIDVQENAGAKVK